MKHWRNRGVIMTNDGIPEDALRFILEEIESVLQLEALLLFLSDRQAVWSIKTVSKRLYIGAREAATLLSVMQKAGFLAEENGMYRYQPASAELGQTAERIAEMYQRHLVPISRLVHSKPKIQKFADAFRIRKDSKDD